mmetsp:Transcript_24021/g.36950  ORF Transcript_24021/g.36950 Transcript_24021/m.36950 type:complete len:88 (-) Transcript_24021:65-328(-)
MLDVISDLNSEDSVSCDDEDPAQDSVARTFNRLFDDSDSDDQHFESCADIPAPLDTSEYSDDEIRVRTEKRSVERLVERAPAKKQSE